MSAKLDTLLNEIDELPIDELLTVLGRVSDQLRHKTATNGNNGYIKPKQEPPPGRIYLDIAGIERPTPEEIAVDLAQIFTPEELAAMEDVDIDNLPPPPPGFPTLTEIVSEGREEFYTSRWT